MIKKDLSINDLLDKEGYKCSCGRTHYTKVELVDIDSGAIKRVPEYVKYYLQKKKVYIIEDENTYRVCGKDVCNLLKNFGIKVKEYIFENGVEPNEHYINLARKNYNKSCEMIITVGTGTLNDIGKIVANENNVPYMIIATAPSMDGFASSTSSIISNGLKVSVNSKCPEIIVGDLDILCDSPMILIAAGLGDIIAKYTSLCEWKIANMVTGQYFCQYIYDSITKVLRKCIDNSDWIIDRDRQAIKSVMESMVLSGIFASFAQCSNPVSGTEHYISHIWDMQGQEFGNRVDYHGIQCAIGTIETLKMCSLMKDIKPDVNKAIEKFDSFDYEDWKKVMISKLGNSAYPMIENEKKEGKYDKVKHKERLKIIVEKWDEIQALIADLPNPKYIEDIMKRLKVPSSIQDLDKTKENTYYASLLTKDIRDKYILTRLLFDIGELDDVLDKIYK